MNSHLKVAAEFARRMWSQRSLLKIEDLMLYGSVARGTTTEESDVDLLLIHDANEAFEKMQATRHRLPSSMTNVDRYRLFLDIARKYGYQIDDILTDPDILDFMGRNMLNVQFLDARFFTDSVYRIRRITASENPEFYDHIFRDGLLWDPATELYSMPARSKYQVKN